MTEVVAGYIQLTINTSCLSNPFTLDVRPSEAATRESYEILDAAAEDAVNVGVRISCLGTFNSYPLGTCEAACEAARKTTNIYHLKSP